MKMKIPFLKGILALLLLCMTFTAPAQEFPEPMQPRRLVNDFAGMFSAQEGNRLAVVSELTVANGTGKALPEVLL